MPSLHPIPKYLLIDSAVRCVLLCEMHSKIMFAVPGAIGRHIVVAFNIAWGVFILASLRSSQCYVAQLYPPHSVKR